MQGARGANSTHGAWEGFQGAWTARKLHLGEGLFEHRGLWPSDSRPVGPQQAQKRCGLWPWLCYVAYSNPCPVSSLSICLQGRWYQVTCFHSLKGFLITSGDVFKMQVPGPITQRF